MDMMTPDIREDRLPSWVRGTLNQLRNKISEQQDTIAIAREEATKSGCTGKVIADGLFNTGFPLHDRARVRFNLPNGHVDVMLRENGALLDINASSAMFIMPRASNDAYVRLEDR